MLLLGVFQSPIPQQVSAEYVPQKAYLEVDSTYLLRIYADEELKRQAVYANLEEIAKCESGGDPLIKNKTSSAKGYLQIINGTWSGFKCEGSVLNKEDNLACGYKIATQSGYHHWDESKKCWGGKVK